MKDSFTPWTPAEDAAIRGWRRSWALLATKLGRGYSATVRRAQRLGARPPRALRWTSREDKVLVIEWGQVSLRELRAKLPGRSSGAIRQRARKLGLAAIPQGWVSRNAAAKRLGLDVAQLVPLLQRHGLRSRRWYAHSSAPHATQYVDLDAVTKALSAEIRSYERVKAIADRHGIRDATLLRWLKAARARMLHTASSSPYLVMPHVAEKVMAAHGWSRGRLPVEAAARRLGVHPSVLWRALQKFNLLPEVSAPRSPRFISMGTARRALQKRVFAGPRRATGGNVHLNARADQPRRVA